jgi:hypothetical protein
MGTDPDYDVVMFHASDRCSHSSGAPSCRTTQLHLRCPPPRARRTAPGGLTRFLPTNLCFQAGRFPAGLIHRDQRVEAQALKGRRRHVGRLGSAALDRPGGYGAGNFEEFPSVDVRVDIRVDVPIAPWRP